MAGGAPAFTAAEEEFITIDMQLMTLSVVDGLQLEDDQTHIRFWHAQHAAKEALRAKGHALAGLWTPERRKQLMEEAERRMDAPD
jgi:hypothetical protein